MALKIYNDILQGSPEWLQARLGILTASEMKLVLTPTLKQAKNDKERQHLYDLMAQRITQYVEPSYVSDDMLRGGVEEDLARDHYEVNYAPVEQVGFITNDKWGFTLGYSPDGLVGAAGLWECKSRRAKYQMQTIMEHVIEGEGLTIPADYMMQCQTGLMVAEREWLDFTSYSGGLPMATMRVYPDEKIQTAIVEVVGAFEKRLTDAIALYNDALSWSGRLIPTERTVETDVEVYV